MKHIFEELVPSVLPLLKGLAHADLAKKIDFFLHEFLLFYVRLLCSINFCFGPVEMRQFKNKCSGLKIDWECVLRHYILLFYTSFCRLGLQLTMALSQARNLLVIFIVIVWIISRFSMNKSPNRAMCTSL